jgi:hypothetical protein
MAGSKKPAKIAVKGNAAGKEFPIKLCAKCNKTITAAKDYVPLQEMSWDNNRFSRRQLDCHRACVKI